MNVETLRALLGWGAVLNIALLSLWFFLFVFARDWIFGLHRRWFDLSPQAFDAIHYAGMAWYKLCTWMFFLIPYLVLRLFL